MVAGLRAAERDFGVGFGIIPAIARFQRPEDAVALVHTVLDDGRPEVLGIGQDYLTTENTEAPELWTEAYALAARHGLRRTAHVAEIPGSTAAAVTVAIRDLDCARIDHGYHVLDDPAVVETARALQIPFTCTPYSTQVLSGWAMTPEHPVARMIRAGLNVTLSTDDPTFFRTDIGREYAEALPAMGFGPDVARRSRWPGSTPLVRPERRTGSGRSSPGRSAPSTPGSTRPASSAAWRGRSSSDPTPELEPP